MPTPVSVICPTYGRPAHLRRLVAYFEAQTYAPIELVILDDSPAPCTELDTDAMRARGVRYHHLAVESRLSIGTKRNRLLELATGEIIVQFDDDDYYAPRYVERIVALLGGADFLSLSGWFNFSFADRSLSYWAADRLAPQHFRICPSRPTELVAMDAFDAAPFIEGNVWGYGFKHAWRTRVQSVASFPDVSWGEDIAFARQVAAGGFERVCPHDDEGLVIHLVHRENTSLIFPQYLLPPFLLERLFPGFAEAYGL